MFEWLTLWRILLIAAMFVFIAVVISLGNILRQLINLGGFIFYRSSFYCLRHCMVRQVESGYIIFFSALLAILLYSVRQLAPVTIVSWIFEWLLLRRKQT